MFSKLWKKSTEKVDTSLRKQIPQLEAARQEHYEKGRYEEALKYATQAADLTRQAYGEKHKYYGISLNELGLLHYFMGNYALAEPAYKQALEIYRATVGDTHPEFATTLLNLAELYRAMNDYTAAEPLLKRSMEITRKSHGEQHPEFARRLNNLAALYKSMGNHTAAEPLYKQALEIKRKTLGPQDPDLALGLNNLAASYDSLGDYASAEPLYKQALEIRRTALGEQHPYYAMNLITLAELYSSMGNYTAAEPLYKQALEIRREAFGEEHSQYAYSLSYLAHLYSAMSDHAAAESLYQQALEIHRTAHGEEHQDVANSLTHLAELYESMSDYASAELLYKQALEIYRAARGEEHPDFAKGLDNLAKLYETMGDYASAESLYRQALEIRRTALGEQHLKFGDSLNNLAVLFYRKDDLAAAEPLFKQVVEVRRKLLGERHPRFAGSLNNLGVLYKQRHDFAAAVPLFKQALEIHRATVGEQHPLFACVLNNLALIHAEMGDFAAAEPLYKQAMEIERKTIGEQHPDFAICLYNLALLYAATDREPEALKMFEQALAIDDRMIGQIFSIASENQRTTYLKTIHSYLEMFLSLVSQHLSDSPEAVRSALSLILRRKAIEAEALATQRDAVLGGKYPEAASKLREITTIRAQIAQQTLAGPGREGLQAHEQLLAEWSAQKERLEAEVSRQVPEMNIEQKLRSVDRQVVAMAMPAEAALVEFVRFQIFDYKAVLSRGDSRWKPARYYGFVMPAGEPELVEMIDLGEAEPIDRMIATFREIITGEAEASERGLGAAPRSAGRVASADAGTQLREAVFTPLLKAIGNRKRLMISPDGDLTRLPFEVLPVDGGRRLIDDYKISYLGAGRDVVRFELKTNRQPTRSLVAADPDFNLGARVMSAETSASTRGRRSHDFKRDSTTTFDRLPGTRLEGEHIAEMIDAELWTGGAALDARLKKCQSPRILHLSTHGFFLEDQKRDPVEDHAGFGAMSFGESGMDRFTGARFENPLLRSGLALAGVNTWLENGELMEEAEDGLLTAEDVSGLDLLDTELVVLSACETGLGEVRVGEGVFGLRRAFVLAGAKTLVMSLWKVPDEQTRKLMEDFYRRILSGEPRADALREAQLAMKAKHPEPIYWGAFICQGDPSPLS
jgi:tetratricopeptide (TPR) repeat protein/CHAT domain-containing protein